MSLPLHRRFLIPQKAGKIIQFLILLPQRLLAQKQTRPPGEKAATKPGLSVPGPATTAASKMRARSKSPKGGNEKVPRRKQKTIPTLVNATNMPSELSAKLPAPSTSIDPEIAVVGYRE